MYLKNARIKQQSISSQNICNIDICVGVNVTATVSINVLRDCRMQTSFKSSKILRSRLIQSLKQFTEIIS